MKLKILITGIAILLICSCQKKETDPSIITLKASPTLTTLCIASAQIKELGSYAITDHGFVYYYGTEDNMETIPGNNVFSLGKVITNDTFSSSLAFNINLNNSFLWNWYVRAYMSNDKGTVYGNPISVCCSN